MAVMGPATGRNTCNQFNGLRSLFLQFDPLLRAAPALAQAAVGGGGNFQEIPTVAVCKT